MAQPTNVPMSREEFEQVQKSLTDSKFQAFLESAPDAIVVVDPSGVIVIVNKLTEEMFGFNRAALLGKPIEMLVPERYRGVHVGHRDEFFANPKTRPMGAGRALTGINSKGSEFPIEISLSPLKTEHGILVISIIRDITERMRAESKFRGFLEAAPDAVVVIDIKGTIVIVNNLTEKMFGYKRDELVGKKVEMLVPKRFDKVHVSHRDGYFANPKTRPMGEGQALAGVRKDGTEFPVEISLSPLESEGGTLVTSIIRDISQRKVAEAKFKGLLESAPDGIVVVDIKGIITIVNSQTESMFGYKREELLGRPVEILVPTKFHISHVAQRDGYIANPATRPMGAGRSLTGRKKDGTEFPVEISLSPLENAEGGTLITSIIRDITEHRLAEEKIKASLREKEVLLKEIHHRVKNNLQVTSSLLKLQSSSLHDPNTRELFEESQNRIRSMALVHEKLYQSSDLSRINFADYAVELSALLFRSFGLDADRVKVKVDGGGVLLSVETAVPCGLIVNELLSNSLKHAFPQGRKGTILITITAEGDKKFILNYKDDGVGIPPELDIEKTETLGLRLVRKLVAQLDGEMAVTSRPGSTFKINFHELKT